MKKILAMFLCAVLILSTMIGTWSIGDVFANDNVQESTDNLGTMPSTWSVKETVARTYGTGLTIPTEPKAESDLYQTLKPFESIPISFEATIKLDTWLATSNTRGGVVIGNYNGGTTCWNFEIHEYGHPRICYYTNGTEKASIIFKNVQVATGEAVRINISYNPDSGVFTCYINGEKKEEMSKTGVALSLPTTKQVVGSDRRLGSQAQTPKFKGTIYDVSVWSDTRTANEVQNSSIEKLDVNDNNLIAAYNFNTLEGKEMNFSDLSGNGYHITRGGIYNLSSKTDGISFTSTSTYATEGTLKDGNTIATMSSWIYLPKTYTSRAGVVFGNYQDAKTPGMSFEINANGVPRFYHVNDGVVSASSNGVRDVQFTGTNVCADEWVHLVFTVDAKNAIVSCYLNGVLQETKTDPYTSTYIKPESITNSYLLGGDLRSGNAQSFKGRIKEVALYNEILTADDIKTLYTSGVESLTGKEPFSYYDVTSAKRYENIPDAKGNNPLIAKADFYQSKEPVTDYAYSFAVVGDTQIVSHYDMENDTNYLGGLYDWILQNKTEKNIQYVFGLGDVTNVNDHKEWSNAQRELAKLDGQIPYSVIRGNHDLIGTFWAQGTTDDRFSDYLGTEAYKSQFEYGDFYSEKNIWNAWRTLTVGEIDYLMLSLDYGATDDVLEWASDVIAEHPTHNVIITTHSYLYRDGTTLDEGDSHWPSKDNEAYNNGDAMWNELISQHENIVLVMSGHDPSDNIVVSQNTGKNNNVVTSMLIDPQGVDDVEWKAGECPTAMVAMLYFSEDGKNIQVEYYSTAKDRYFKKENQRSLTINVVDDKIDNCEKVSVPYTAEQAKEYLNGQNYYPRRTGYVFAGWYTNEVCDEQSMLKDATPNNTVYALFVPKGVLSIKAQVSANLIDTNNENDATGSIRFVTTVDSLRYKEVGFELSYINNAGQTLGAVSKSKIVYNKLYEMNGRSAWGRTPEGTFCAESKYFRACTIANLSLNQFKDIKFKVRPYWITAEGDKVYGESVTKSIQQGINASTSTNPYNIPEYVGVLTGTHNGSSPWTNVWQGFSGYEVGETYVFTCDYYMPQGSKASMRFRGSSSSDGGNVVTWTGLDGTNQAVRGTKSLEYTIQEGDERFFGPCLVQEPGGVGYFWNIRVTKKGSNVNLLTNADFMADIGGSWSGWTFGNELVDNKVESDGLAASHGASIIPFDTNIVGPWKMVKIDAQGSWAEDKRLSQGISTEAGKTYVFTCDYYIPEGASGNIRFRIWDGVSLQEPGADQWLKGQGTAYLEFTAEQAYSYFGAQLLQNPDSAVDYGYYWNIRLTEKGSDVNLLKNAGFENEFSNWSNYRNATIEEFDTSFLQ